MRRSLASVLLVAATACNIPERSGAGAARYATNQMAEAAAAARESGCPHAECVAHATVKGALSELATPEERARLEAIIRGSVEDALAAATSPEQLAQVQLIAETAARSAVRGALGEMPRADSIVEQTVGAVRRSFGDDGEGPLAKSLAAAAERISASTVRGIRDEVALFPECSGPARARCIDKRLTELSRAASVGVQEGLRGLVAIPLLALSFVLGLIVAFLVSLLVSHRRTGGEPMQAGRRHRHALAH